MAKDIGQVEHKLGLTDRPTTGRPGTRGRTARGKRGSTAEPEEPKENARSKKNKFAVVSEVRREGNNLVSKFYLY